MLELITDVSLNKLLHRKTDDVKLNNKQRHLNGDTVQDAVLLQNRKFRLIYSNLASTCSTLPNLENEYPRFMFLTINNDVIGSGKWPNHASCLPLLLDVS